MHMMQEGFLVVVGHEGVVGETGTILDGFVALNHFQSLEVIMW